MIKYKFNVLWNVSYNIIYETTMLLNMTKQINNNSVNKTGKRSNNATIWIINAPVHAGRRVNGTNAQNLFSSINSKNALI